ncbi:unnamed protein product [Penicillium bialowiezense]
MNKYDFHSLDLAQPEEPQKTRQQKRRSRERQACRKGRWHPLKTRAHRKANERDKRLDQPVAGTKIQWGGIKTQLTKAHTHITNRFDTKIRKRLPRRELTQIIHRALTARYPEAYYRRSNDHHPTTGVYLPYTSKVGRCSVEDTLWCCAHDPELCGDECSPTSTDTTVVSNSLSPTEPCGEKRLYTNMKRSEEPGDSRQPGHVSNEVRPAAVRRYLCPHNQNDGLSQRPGSDLVSIAAHDGTTVWGQVNDVLIDDLRSQCIGAEHEVTTPGSSRSSRSSRRSDAMCRDNESESYIATTMRNICINVVDPSLLLSSSTNLQAMATPSALTVSANDGPSVPRRPSLLLRDIDKELSLLQQRVARTKRVTLARPEQPSSLPPAPGPKVINPYDLRAKLMFGDLPPLPSETSDDLYSVSDYSLYEYNPYDSQWSLESRCSQDSDSSLSTTASLAAPTSPASPAAPAPSPSRSPQRLLNRLTAIPSACRGILRRRAAFTSGPIMPVEQTEVAPGPHGPRQCKNAWPEVTELGHLLEARPVSWDGGLAPSCAASATGLSSHSSPVEEPEEQRDWRSSLPSDFVMSVEAGMQARNRRRYINRGFI